MCLYSTVCRKGKLLYIESTNEFGCIGFWSKNGKRVPQMFPGRDKTSMGNTFLDWHRPNKWKDANGRPVNKSECPGGFWYWFFTTFGVPEAWVLNTMCGSGTELAMALLAMMNVVACDDRRSQVRNQSSRVYILMFVCCWHTGRRGEGADTLDGGGAGCG